MHANTASQILSLFAERNTYLATAMERDALKLQLAEALVLLQEVKAAIEQRVSDEDGHDIYNEMTCLGCHGKTAWKSPHSLHCRLDSAIRKAGVTK